MEVVAGTISRVDFATNGNLKFSFAHDLTNIARSTIYTAREPNPEINALPELGIYDKDLSQNGFSHPATFLEVSLPALFTKHICLLRDS